MAYDLIQMPSKYLDNKEDHFSWRLLVFTLDPEVKQSAIVGRHSTCDFLINAPKLPCFLSRKHASLRIEKNTLYVKDLKSTNGTFKNNVMLKPNMEYKLSSGDLVAFGCKSEKRPTPGNKISQQETPFLFKIIKSKDNKLSDSVVKEDDEPKLEDPKSDSDVGSKSSSSPKLNQDLESTSIASKLNPPPSSSPNGVTQDSSSPNEVAQKRKSSFSRSARKSRKKSRILEMGGDKTNSFPPTVDVEKCSSAECKVSLQNDDVATWVQCDSCDKWFHTMCVGCSYDEVKDHNQQFYCGFCKPNKSG